MIQAKMVKPGIINFEDVEEPIINDEEILIDMKKIGICGSDIHVYHGKHPYTEYPIIQGHEVSGEIIQVGKNVEKFNIGDRIVVQPQVYCGECYSCKSGNYHICDNLKVMGFQTDGLAKEFCKINKSKAIKIPKTMSFEKGALVEPIAVATHALSRSKINIKNKNIVVIGAGTIGNLVAQVAKAKGAEVLITDISDYRLNLAKLCGINHTLNTKKYNLEKNIINTFGSKKADLILECVGLEETINQAINYSRKGAEIIVVGVFSENTNINIGYVQDRELSIVGSLMYKREDFIDAINLLKDNKINTDKLITKEFEFRQYKEAYEYIEKKKDEVMKIMINV